MSYSRRELYAMGEPLGESVTRKEGGRIIYGGGGGGGPTSSTVTQSNVPDWLRPQVENVLMGAGKNLFQTRKVDSGTKDEAGNVIYNEEITGTKPFVPYSSDPSKYVAGFSPLQQQVQYNAANLQMPGQFNQATGYANAAAQGGLDTAAQAAGYGNAGFQSGQMGQQLGIQGGARFGEMGAGYGQQGAQIGTQGGQYYGGMGAGYGAQAANLAPEAQQYGRTAADIGQMGLRAEQYGRQVSGQAQDYAAQAARAGQQYAAQMTDPYAVQRYMNPYQSAVTDVQIQGAQRQADIAAQGRKAAAARAGAYGGARQAIENAEANRALASQMDAIRAQGQQTAYDKAIQSMQYGSNLGLQGLQGAQQGLGTALQGGQLGLSGIGTAMQGQQAGMQGLGQAGQLYGLGMQGAQTGLQGVNTQLAGTAQGMQGAQVGLQGVDRQLAGTAQGMQGAQVGLQGVSGQQAGYGLANQAAGQLGQLGTQQLAAQTGILGLQNQIGGQQQGQQQQIINQAIQNYAQAQEAPMTAFNQYNALLRGYAVPGQTTTQYQAQPTLANQITGFGTAGVGALALNNALNPR
jgi:hypothetical protein